MQLLHEDDVETVFDQSELLQRTSFPFRQSANIHLPDPEWSGIWLHAGAEKK